MSRWFRSYADTHRNPKVARLSDADFRLWHELLCVASDNDGNIPPLDDLKHLLNRRLDHLSKALKRLISGGLIDALDGGYSPRNWGERQYKSDTSTGRVHKFRAKRNVSETPPDTDTDITVSNDTGVPPSDPLKEMWDLGVSILVSTGTPEKQARSLLGKWRKAKGEVEVLAALLDCRARSISEPVEWIEKRFKSARYVSPSGYEYRGTDEQVMREAEKRGDNGTYWAAKAAIKARAA